MLPLFIKEKVKELKKRAILDKIATYLNLPEIIVLLGMRQTGKTSLLYLITELLKQQKIPDSNLFYFSLEDPTILASFNKNIKDLELFLKNQKIDEGFKIFIFIDEIQYLNNPTNFLKYYFDNFPKLKFIITGSSTFQLKQKFKDSLAGRKKTILVKPLNFKEFLYFKGIDFNLRVGFKNLEETTKLEIDGITQEKIKQYFQEYIIFGGHPKIPLLDTTELKITELKDIYNDYIRKDIKDIAKIENLDAYNALLQVSASQIGNLFNSFEVSNTINLNHLTLTKYLFLLENSFVISSLKPFFKNKRKEITKMPKLYLEDVGIRNAIVSDFKPFSLRQDVGQLVENFVFNELDKQLEAMDKLNFWRTLSKQEVDFVYQKDGVYIPIEVKYQVLKTTRVPSGLRSFIKNYHPKNALVITQDFSGTAELEKTKIYFLPAYYL